MNLRPVCIFLDRSGKMCGYETVFLVSENYQVFHLLEPKLFHW